MDGGTHARSCIRHIVQQCIKVMLEDLKETHRLMATLKEDTVIMHKNIPLKRCVVLLPTDDSSIADKSVRWAHVKKPTKNAAPSALGESDDGGQQAYE